jgi:chitinase
MLTPRQLLRCALAGSPLLLASACTDFSDTSAERKRPRPDAGTDPSPEPNPGPDTEAPSAPVVDVTAFGPTYVSLAWSSTDNRDATLVYQVTINGVAKPTSSITSQTFQLLRPETAYTFSVRARDGSLNWSAVTTLVVTTPAVDPDDATPPTTPTNVWADSYGDLEMQVFWTASTDNATDQVAILYEIFVNGVHENTSVGTPHTPSAYGVHGENVVTVEAIDEAGNRSGAGSFTIHIP